MEETKLINLTDNSYVNLVFDLINHAEQYGSQKIDMVICNNKHWFKGKDIARLLEYKNTDGALRDHVDNNYKILLHNLYDRFNPLKSKGLRGNQKNTIYINEAGLYQLIFSSKQDIAINFKKWVLEDMLPKIRKIGQEQFLLQLQESRLQIQEKDKLLQNAEAKLNRLNLLNIENLSFKKKLSKNETIYIVSTYAYSIQGIYKIGRTKNMKSRNSSHNTTHAPGDKVKILAEYKVNDSTLSERNIHNKLAGLALKDETEIFMCPFDMLNSLVDLVINCDEQLNDAVNRIIDMVYKLRTEQFDKDKWIIGLDMSVFRDEMQLITNGNISTEHTIAATFDMTTATEAQKQKFVRECIAAYRRTIQQPDTTESPIFNIAWKAFQEFIMSRLEVPRSRFKALEWKPFVKTEVNSNPQLMIQWRSG